uniref:TLDc domain-containing protein n=1 Tax=Rhizophagus irregularis (strain DAOM 181602 / DAOM 197198 / MUCL 43194) TaxID=747089 RepID=U9UTB3_RHIID
MKPKTNVAPSRKLNLKFKLDSTLIESNHIPLFASWIDKKDSSYNKNKIPYEFKLLYRSSRDGFNGKTFHKNCDNKGATIWVAKIQGSTQLIGGYNPLDWNGHKIWKKTADSFLFNFTDGKDISTAKLGYVNNTNYAIFCYNNYGPYTGDLCCQGSNDWACYDHSNYYPKIGIPKHFIVENYEVFQVIRQ